MALAPNLPHVLCAATVKLMPQSSQQNSVTLKNRSEGLTPLFRPAVSSVKPLRLTSVTYHTDTMEISDIYVSIYI